MNKPVDFQINIRSEEEFQEAWEGLVAAGYAISPHTSEKEYLYNRVIKHSSGHGYIWASEMRDSGKRQFTSYEQFKTHNRQLFKPSMSDVTNLVALVEQLTPLREKEAEAVKQLNALRGEIATKENRVKELQEMLGVAG